MTVNDRDTLILLWERMWGQPIDEGAYTLPDGVELTEDKRRISEADAVVFHMPQLPRLPWRMPRKRPGQLWVAWSMECEAHYRRLRSPRFMRRFDVLMSYKQHADVFVSYIPDSILSPVPPPPKSDERLLCSFISSRHDRSGRNAYLDELSRHLDVHSYGRRGTRVVENDVGRESKLATIGGYRFTIAFENAIAEDYVTEKFFDPLVAGSVPVVLGAPNVSEFAPVDDCYVDVADFSSPAELAAHLVELAADERRYDAMVRWHDRPMRPSFRALYERQAPPATERLADCVLRRLGRSGSEAPRA